jgi:prolyl-tRNA synthetase
MQEDEIRELFHSPVGYLGPIGIDWARGLGNEDANADANDSAKPILLVDKALEGRTNLIGGANKEEYHLKHLATGKNFQPTAYVDLRSVTAGEDCPNCGAMLCASIPQSRSDTSSSSATNIRNRWARESSTATEKKSPQSWEATG